MSVSAVSGINPYYVYDQKSNLRENNNKKEMNRELFANNYKTNNKQGLVTVAGVGASLLAADYISKSGTIQTAITTAAKKIATSKVGKFAIDAIKDFGAMVAPYAKKAATWFTALPTSAKVVAIAGVAVTALIAGIVRHNGAKNAGKIEQKYQDMAALNK